MTRDTSISRAVLSDQVKDRLLRAILDGRYPPGARIVETRVAREFGTSQAPVREALRDLEALGVVETTAFRGARVRRPTADELLEAFGIRAELESLGARLAVPRLRETDLAELAEHVRAMQQAAEAGDPYAEATADAAFHALIVRVAGNVTLERVWRYLEPFSRTYITLVVPGADWRGVANLHLPVLDALQRGNPDQAVDALQRHFVNAGSMLGRLWADAASPGAPHQPDSVARPQTERLPAGVPAAVPRPA